MRQIEKEFNQDMILICESSKRDIGYNPTRFRQLINRKGALIAVKELINSSSVPTGLTTLWENGRLDLSVESQVLKEKYKELFTENEISICKIRLTQLEYDFKQ